MDKRLKEEGLAFHAARLLLLIEICGASKKAAPSIEGRTLLAKLDFFLRYPKYLNKAAAIRKVEVQTSALGLDSPDELNTVESHMVRYRYGPWDHIYYATIAYLVGKSLISVATKGGNDVFVLTKRGSEIAEALKADETYQPLVRRAVTVRRLFHGFSGNGLKVFIYANFPEVVGKKLGAEI